ncbi:MAG: hypothetical protein M1823_002800 [Watsoniomyces obsoletus]|nr:MAG: hypothetical protein M1823_002800 [Watsoniomyces obsoletus]
MVAAALGNLGITTARVNERHDIVFDGLRIRNKNGHNENDSESGATIEQPIPLKVSGSAYKLTTSRSLHHGTCLLSSDLDSVRNLLRSPAKGFIEARGVQSVSSPVGNVHVSKEAFQEAVIREFAAIHNLDSDLVVSTMRKKGVEVVNDESVSGTLDEKDVEEIEEIQEGIRELRVRFAYLFNQA